MRFFRIKNEMHLWAAFFFIFSRSSRSLCDFVSFCLQTNYMQSITFVLIAASRRWLLLFCFVLFLVRHHDVHCRFQFDCLCTIYVYICMRFIWAQWIQSALSRFCWTGNLWLYNQYFSSFISCGFWLFLFFFGENGAVAAVAWHLCFFRLFLHEIWIVCTVLCTSEKYMDWKKKQNGISTI